jgi:hypothetical protein
LSPDFLIWAFLFIFVYQNKLIMIKLTNQDSSGTSFHNVTVFASVNELISLLGEPQYECNDGSDKVNFEWTCLNRNSEIFTIYDWKQYRKISEDETIEWHIGGKNISVTSAAAYELQLALSAAKRNTK